MRILTKKTRREVAAGRLGFYCGSPENARKAVTHRSDLAGDWLYHQLAMFSEEKKRARQERWKAAKKDNTSDDWIERIRKSLPEHPTARRDRYEKELGLSDDHEGILLLDESAPVGTPGRKSVLVRWP